KTDDIPRLNEVGSYVYLLAVHGYVTVGDELACACACIREPEAVSQVVQAALQQNHEILTRDALHLGSFHEQVGELLLVKAVHMAKLLLLHQLYAVTAHLAAHP